MVKHDPSDLPLSKTLKYTENTATIPMGDGLWMGASEGPGTFRIYAVDPTSEQVGFFGPIKEWNRPVLLALRLKIVDGSIAEIEHVVARNMGGPGMANLVTARAAFGETVPSAERVSRQEMARIANSYFDSIEQTKSSIAPFAADCTRHENGTQTTTNVPAAPTGNALRDAQAKVDRLNCGDQIDTGNLSYITSIRPRRLVIVDEEKGLVFGFPMFVHRGNVRTVKITGVPGVESLPKDFGPINLMAGEIFKIRGGKIHEIEANGFLLPYNAGNGWE
jgi:hypothetical protein